jgi:uncharacterized protein CbrC (UPF0167 family)
MTEALPSFRYHPDPIATGSIGSTDDACPVCEQARGFAYTGAVYAVEEVDGPCPWCIADGSLAARFDAELTDSSSIDGGVPEAAVEEIALRTPGFSGWQQERWLGHCGDGAAFVGRVGWDELQAHPDAIEHLRSQFEAARVPDVDWMLETLHVDGDLTAYLFRCLTCGTHTAYWDAS